MASVTYGKCYLWQKYYGKCNYSKSIMANETEPKKNLFWKRLHPQSRSFERRICAQTQDLQIFKKCNMFQMNPKEVFHNTAYSVQLPYIADHTL